MRAQKSAIVQHTSSSIRTIPLVPEFHRVSGYTKRIRSRTFTASGEFHPALKTFGFKLSVHIIYCVALNCNPNIWDI